MERGYFNNPNADFESKDTLYNTYVNASHDRLDENAVYINATGEMYSNRELLDLIDKASKGFQFLGINQKSKVGILLSGTVEEIVTLFALNKLGAVSKYIDFTKSVVSIKHSLDETNLDLLVIDECFLELEQNINEKNIPVVIANTKNHYDDKRYMSYEMLYQKNIDGDVIAAVYQDNKPTIMIMDKSDFEHMLQALRFLPKITGARIIAEETGTEFEELYSQMTDKLTYTTFTDDEKPFPPLGKMNTQRFLGVTADDMLYRINTLDGISPEILGEIEVFKTRFSNVQKQVPQPISTPELFNVLADINRTFGDVYMFESTFAELLNNFTDSRYISLFRLLSEVVNQEKDALERVNNDDERTEARTTSAKRISRLLGIIANSAIRTEVFGF